MLSLLIPLITLIVSVNSMDIDRSANIEDIASWKTMLQVFGSGQTDYFILRATV